MKTTSFREEQQQALLDLLIMGMYADAHLALTEDRRLHAVLQDFGLTDEAVQRRWLGDSLTRVSRRAATAAGQREYVAELGRNFKGVNEGMSVIGALQQLLGADGKIGEREQSYLAEIEEVLQ